MHKRPNRALYSTALALGLLGGSASTPLVGVALAAAPAGAVDPCAPGQFYGDTYFPTPAFRNQANAPAITRSAAYRVETVVPVILNPRSLGFIGAGRMIVAEQPGLLRIIEPDGRMSAPLGGMPPSMPGRDGGIDIAIDPDFAKNRTLYLAYRIPTPGAVAGPGERPPGTGQIASARLSEAGDRLENYKVIYEGGYLRRLTVARDGTLIITTLAEGAPAQKVDDVNGKVLRINKDGSIPRNNPYLGTKGAKPELYDIGHRDVDGVTIDSKGQIWTVEHGPRGGDEVNRIRPGRNYGFPVIGYGREYSGAPINNDLTAKRGMEQPVYYWHSPDIGPGGVLVYSGRMFPEWKDDIFIGALATKRLVRLDMKNGRVTGEEHLLADRCKRIRDVREAPDGSIYVLTNQDGGGQVLRITR
ncbi:MAG: PQQ-dependent sugar dehydrogenase [Steroidobacteraceae bacterium]